MTDTILQCLLACFASFDEFFDHTRDPQIAQTDGLVVEAWRDELGRLRLWASNVDAHRTHRTGQSYLDLRLRNASHVRGQIVNLLKALRRRIQDAQAILFEVGDREDDEVFVDDHSDDEETLSEIEELQQSIANIITCLFRMAMLVRNPAQHDLLLGSKAAEASAFARFDYNHVRDKFPEADLALVSRLAKAITRRRNYLQHRKIHAAILNSEAEDINQNNQEFQVQDDSVSESDVYALSDTVSTDTSAWSAMLRDEESQAGGSQTSYSTSSMTGNSLTIPFPPKASENGAPFECPYCRSTLTIHNTRSWIAHVFQDLQPYVCVDLECVTPHRLYPTSHQWLDHVMVAHPRSPLSKRNALPGREVNCSLCNEAFKAGNQYARHLARHSQELTLFCLPRGEDGTDVSDGGSGDSTASEHSHSSAAIGNSGVSMNLDITNREGQGTTTMDMEKCKEQIAHIINTRQSQQPGEGWQAAVPASLRIDAACQLFSQLQLLPARMNVLQEIEIITNFEQRTFSQSPDQGTYKSKCRAKMAEIASTGGKLARAPTPGLPQQQDFIVPLLTAEPTVLAKYDIDCRVKMRTKIFAIPLVVADRVFDANRGGWIYLLKDEKGTWVWKLVRETNLERT